jgi:hypothetical protein
MPAACPSRDRRNMARVVNFMNFAGPRTREYVNFLNFTGSNRTRAKADR